MSPVGGIKKLAIIAGRGELPAILAESCESQGIEVFIVGFEKYTDPALMDGRHHMWGRLGGAGHIIKTLKAQGIADLVMIGGIRRPSLAELRPDFKTMSFYARLGLRALGDNDFLAMLVEELAKDGLKVHGVQDFAHNLLVQAGPLGRIAPLKSHIPTIERGIEVARIIGASDIGQSVIVQQGQVIGVEGAEGTDALIMRCKDYLRKGEGGILVKLSKPGQLKNMDLPTIGPDTVILAGQNGLCGVVVQAGATLVVSRQRVADFANQHNMFVLAVDVEDGKRS